MPATGRYGKAVLCIGLALFVHAAFAQEAPDPVEHAVGFLDHLVEGEYDEAFGMFDPPMESALPVETLELTWKSLLGGAGAFKEVSGSRHELTGMFHTVILTCEFERGAQDIRIVLNNAMEVSGLWLVPQERESAPPPYADPARFEESDIEIGEGEWALPGTLSMPEGDGPFAAVVLVHGSGPHDRDESIGPNKPFRDLAWGLASRGIAVLRYEKRTKHYQAKLLNVPGNFTVDEETVVDAAAAVNALRFTPRIDNGNITVVGHSLGGMLAPRIAKKNPAVTGLVILAGSTRPLGELLLEQLEYVFTLDGKIEKGEQRVLEQTKQQVEKMRDPNLSVDTPAVELPFGVPASYWIDLREYEPAAVAKSLHIPMLILQGGRDYQVTEKDFKGWRDALGGKDGVTLRMFPALNHLFMTGQGKSTPDEYAVPGHVDETVVELIGEWIQSQP